MSENIIKSFVKKALEEDIGEGDYTTLATIPDDLFGEAVLLVKQEGILAGVNIAKEIFQCLDKNSKVEIYITDGTYCDGNNNIALKVYSNVHVLLKAERLVLNILQRMSGIATITNKYVKAVEGTPAKILDTRKTTPGFRYFEKLAVKIGGGQNHRMGLYDQILIKDNHIDFAGGIDKVLTKTKEFLEKKSLKIPVEVEARTLSDIEEILKYDFVQTILLDNFTIEKTKEAVKLIDKRKKIESSGGITLSNVRDYALCGVDYISIGSLTHHVQSLDLSLKAKLK